MAKSQIFRGKILLKEFSPTSSTTNRILSYNSSTGEITYRDAIDTSGFLTSTLTSGNILVGNGSNVATSVAMSGDVTISNAGVTAIGTGVIVNADINASAAIAYSKLNLSGSIVNADVNASAGIVYSKLNLTGGILNADVNASAAIARSKIATGTAYRFVTNNVSGALTDTAVTASRAVVTDSNGLPTASATTAIQIGYLSTASSNIQTQISNLIVGQPVNALVQSPSAAEDGYSITWDDAAGEYTLIDPVTQGIPTAGTARQFLGKNSSTNYDASWLDLVVSDISDLSSTVDDLNILSGADAAGVTSTEFQYLNGVTSSIQTQLDLKLASALTENYMFVGNASNLAVPFATGTNGYVLTSVGGVPTWVAPGSGGTVTSINVSGGTTGLTFSGGAVTTSGTITMAGTLDVDNGGTSYASYTKGDILVATGATALAKLAVGTNNYVLTADSGEASGVKWAAAASSGHTIQDEGTPLTARANLNFVGSSVTVTDDAGNNATVVTISGGTITGTDTHVMFFDGANTPAGDAGFTYNKTSNTATIDGVILNAETASRVAIIDASKNIKSADTATYPSLTELSYVKGVTSAIQTQFTAKAALASPTFTGTPAAPTATTGDNSTQIATTAFVTNMLNATSTAIGNKIFLYNNFI